MKQRFIAVPRRNTNRKTQCFRLFRLLALEREGIGDHGDEFAVRGLSLDIRHRIAEELLQHLDIAAVPGDLDRVADFQGLRPERGGALPPFQKKADRGRFIALFIGSVLPC